MTLNDHPFGKYEEEAIIGLVLDHPEIFSQSGKFLTISHFRAPEAQIVLQALKQDFEQFDQLPSRALLRDRLMRELKPSDPYEEVLRILETPPNPRDIPIIKKTFIDWVRHKTYELLYSDEAIAAHARGDFQYIHSIIDQATRLSDVNKQGFWLFDQLEELFVDSAIEHIGTGFKELDQKLNEGGPSPGEVLVWLAPTGVGKTLMLVNNAVQAIRDGHDVLFVTFELSVLKTALRMIGSISGIPINAFSKGNIDQLENEEVRALRGIQSQVKQSVKTLTKGWGQLVVYELPPNECSVDEIYSIIDFNKKHRSWRPKVVILDYLELMMSRRASMNDDEYARQKNVSTEVRGLARNEKVLVYSATQTNRSGMDGVAEQTNIGVEKQAESFGKAMPVDYMISLNQTDEEYQRQNTDSAGNSVIRLWIAKNRNGPKFHSITTEVNYQKMRIRQVG